MMTFRTNFLFSIWPRMPWPSGSTPAQSSSRCPSQCSKNLSKSFKVCAGWYTTRNNNSRRRECQQTRRLHLLWKTISNCIRSKQYRLSQVQFLKTKVSAMAISSPRYFPWIPLELMGARCREARRQERPAWNGAARRIPERTYIIWRPRRMTRPWLPISRDKLTKVAAHSSHVPD